MQLDDIKIEVAIPELRSEIGGVNKYFVYPLTGNDSKGEIVILRRYSDFNLLREVLLKRWPGCYIPSIPEKKTIGSSEQIFVQSRRRGLQIFLQTLAHSEVIWYSQQTQIFLKNTTEDLQALISYLLKQTFDKILARYRLIFSDMDTGDVMKDAAANIANFSTQLKYNKLVLQNLSEQTQKMYDVYHSYSQKKLAVLEILLPQYQKNCLLENDEKKSLDMLFAEAERYDIKEKVDIYRKFNQYPPILLVTEEIKQEKRQIQAFEEVIRAKNQVQSLKLKASGKLKDYQTKQSNINAGKQSIFSRLTKQSKQSQLAENKQNIDSAKAEEALYTHLFQILTNMIGTREIYKFKQFRQKVYYKMLKNYANLEKEMANAEKDIWIAAQNHDQIGEGEKKIDTKLQEISPNYDESEEQIPEIEDTKQAFQKLREQESIKSDQL